MRRLYRYCRVFAAVLGVGGAFASSAYATSVSPPGTQFTATSTNSSLTATAGSTIYTVSCSFAGVTGVTPTATSSGSLSVSLNPLTFSSCTTNPGNLGTTVTQSSGPTLAADWISPTDILTSLTVNEPVSINIGGFCTITVPGSATLTDSWSNGTSTSPSSDNIPTQSLPISHSGLLCPALGNTGDFKATYYVSSPPPSVSDPGGVSINH